MSWFLGRVADKGRLPLDILAPNADTRVAMEESRALMAARADRAKRRDRFAPYALSCTR